MGVPRWKVPSRICPIWPKIAIFAFQPFKTCSKQPNQEKHISRGHSVCANTVGFATFPGFCDLLVQCAKISSLWGGMRPFGGIFFKSVRKGCFRNVWVGGGGGGEMVTLFCAGQDRPVVDSAQVQGGQPSMGLRPRPMGTQRTKTWFTPREVVRRNGEDTTASRWAPDSSGRGTRINSVPENPTSTKTELQIGRCRVQSNARGTTDYSESDSSSLLPPFTRAGTPLRHTSASL